MRILVRKQKELTLADGSIDIVDKSTWGWASEMQDYDIKRCVKLPHDAHANAPQRQVQLELRTLHAEYASLASPCVYHRSDSTQLCPPTSRRSAAALRTAPTSRPRTGPTCSLSFATTGAFLATLGLAIASDLTAVQATAEPPLWQPSLCQCVALRCVRTSLTRSQPAPRV